MLLLPRTPWPATAALSPDSTDTVPSPTSSLTEFPATTAFGYPAGSAAMHAIIIPLLREGYARSNLPFISPTRITARIQSGGSIAAGRSKHQQHSEHRTKEWARDALLSSLQIVLDLREAQSNSETGSARFSGLGYDAAGMRFAGERFPFVAAG